MSRHPDRIKSLTVLSHPHPAAFRRAFTEDASDQKHRSRHHKAFHDPNTATMLLENDAARLRKRLADSGVPPASIEEYVSVLGAPEGVYQFAVIAGAGHFLTDQPPSLMTRLILDHIQRAQ